MRAACISEGDVMATRGKNRFAVAAAACLFGSVGATASMPPTANADQLPNGYSVTCTPNGQHEPVCSVSGCPRVHGDEAGDVIHVNGKGFFMQPELSKGCNNTATFPINATTTPITFSIQGCRKHFPGTDDCGSWSDYTYVPPAAAPAPAAAPDKLPVRCTGGPDAGKTLPPGSTCPAAPVQAAPVKCPAGSVTDTVPAGQQCSAPTNAATLNITRNGLNAHAAITNNSSLPAKCTYTATKSGIGFGPQEVDRSVDVGAGSTATITDMLWPPPGTSYNAVVKCTVTYNGKQTTIGQPSQNVSG